MPSRRTHTTPTPFGCRRKCRRFAARRLGGRYRCSTTKSASPSTACSSSSSSGFRTPSSFDAAARRVSVGVGRVSNPASSVPSAPPSVGVVSFREARFRSRSSRAAAVAAASSARFLSRSSRAATTAAAAAAAASRARFSLSASASTRASSSSSARLIAAGKSTSSNCFFRAAALSVYRALSSPASAFQPAPNALPIAAMSRAHSGGCAATKPGRTSLA